MAASLRLFDAHCHLHDVRLAAAVVDVLDRAKATGVRRVCVNATREEDWDAVLSLHAAHPAVVVPCLGVHPWFAHTASPTWEAKLRGLLREHAAVHVGECGLDKPKAKALAKERASDWREEFALQVDVFEAHARVAADLGRSMSVHCVRATGDVIDVLRKCRPAAGTLMHSFPGPADIVPTFVKLGCMLSFSGAVARPKVMAAAVATPLEALLIETDSPDQFPVGLLPSRGDGGGAGAGAGAGAGPAPGSGSGSEPRPGAAAAAPAARALNEPRHVASICAAVAHARGVSTETVAAATTANAERLFGVADSDSGAS